MFGSASATPGGQGMLGRTPWSLLDEACGRTPNDTALNQWRNRRWQSMSNQTLRQQAEAVALGLLDLGLQRGDRVAFALDNSFAFVQMELGCWLAGLVTVPIDLTQTLENISYVLQHTEAKALAVANGDLLQQLTSQIWENPTVQWVVVAEPPADWGDLQAWLTETHPGLAAFRDAPLSACLHMPKFLCKPETALVCPAPLPQCSQLLSLEALKEKGRQDWSIPGVQTLRQEIVPSDLATIIYIASETACPQGVMLTQGQVTGNLLAAFTSYPDLRSGPDEVALLFLPLTHIFARVFLYGHLAYGHSVYLSDPNHLIKHLRSVRPTLMITVPRLLEKFYGRILDRGHHLRGVDHAMFHWALALAERFDISHPPKGLAALQLQLAQRLVLHRWRAIFGDRLQALICGGAPLRAGLVNLFAAAGIPVLQGYGLTETSGVLCYNRGDRNQPGTVGTPIPGVDLSLAEDGEVLVKAPFVMAGYYRDLAATQAAIDANGWLHTGDLGRLSADGCLTLTGVKKDRFKLSTGKYVSPLPLERAVEQSSLVRHAVAVGAGQKFCAMVIVPNWMALRAGAEEWGLEATGLDWPGHPRLLVLYQQLIDRANCHLPDWSTVRQFCLADGELTVENGGLYPDGRLNRAAAWQQFEREIAELYRHKAGTHAESLGPDGAIALTDVTVVTCPTYARSLQHP